MKDPMRDYFDRYFCVERVELNLLFSLLFEIRLQTVWLIKSVDYSPKNLLYLLEL